MVGLSLGLDFVDDLVDQFVERVAQVARFDVVADLSVEPILAGTRTDAEQRSQRPRVDRGIRRREKDPHRVEVVRRKGAHCLGGTQRSQLLPFRFGDLPAAALGGVLSVGEPQQQVASTRRSASETVCHAVHRRPVVREVSGATWWYRRDAAVLPVQRRGHISGIEPSAAVGVVSCEGVHRDGDLNLRIAPRQARQIQHRSFQASLSGVGRIGTTEAP